MTTVLGSAPIAERRGAGRPPVAIVAAHPDDETISAAALLLRTPGAAVVHVTDGAPRDRALWTVPVKGGRRDYAALRRAEVRRAMELAGVAPDRLHSLGAVDQEAALELVPLSLALARLLAALRPKRVVTHPYEGGHPDHDAAAFVTRAALDLLRRSGARPPPLFEMTSYHSGPDGTLRSCDYLDPGAAPVHTRVLRPVERQAKGVMLAAFETQRPVIAWFPRELERLRRAPPCDFSRPPHDGPLWYERMGFPMTGARWRALARQAATRLAREAPRLLAEVDGA